MPNFTKETRANMLLVRNRIAEMEAKRFNMSSWGSPSELKHNCGSAGCIGGWAEALLFDYPKEYYTSSADVGEKIGLSEEESENLFFMIKPYDSDGGDYMAEMFMITQLHAVKMLDHILDGGEIDWDLIVFPPPGKEITET